MALPRVASKRPLRASLSTNFRSWWSRKGATMISSNFGLLDAHSAIRLNNANARRYLLIRNKVSASKRLSAGQLCTSCSETPRLPARQQRTARRRAQVALPVAAPKTCQRPASASAACSRSGNAPWRANKRKALAACRTARLRLPRRCASQARRCELRIAFHACGPAVRHASRRRVSRRPPEDSRKRSNAAEGGRPVCTDAGMPGGAVPRRADEALRALPMA
mmetsp:Transcript_162599/g.516594  ORF Transcript_162599/g.516594 Transcript_162599/m.516594 type:complete len:222 (+) Transcript_162599:747-1412(+)